MRIFRFFFKIAVSRYLLTLCAFVAWMLFFDEKNYFSQRERQAELDALNHKIEYYQTQLAATNRQLIDSGSNSNALEKVARERYFMKRDNEDVFVVDTAR